MSVLGSIVDRKKGEVARLKARLPETTIRELLSSAPPVRGFKASLQAFEGPAIIAEVKRASPSKGVLCPDQSPVDFDPIAIAKAYEANGARALSILTDTHYFWGSEDLLGACREAVKLPVLRKEFIVDAYQVAHSRWLGADAILLLARCLSQSEIQEFAGEALQLGMDVLIEIHHQEELEKALCVPEALVGINHRDLSTLEMHSDRALELKSQIPDDRLVVGESGMRSAADIQRLQAGGIHTFLIGSHLVASGDPGGALAALLPA